MLKNDNPLWVERYRPARVADVVLPRDARRQFAKWARDKEVPVNLLLAGPPGLGKTTVARALLSEVGADYIELNGSLHGNIDTLRGTITQFASTVSLAGGRKFVLIDEADHLNAVSTQPALRNFLETFSANCGFVFTCNWIERIIEPLRGRCAVYEFKIKPDEVAPIKAEMFKRLESVLRAERVEYDPKAVAYVLEKYFPDLRRTINQLQAYSSVGAIDSGILAQAGDQTIDALVSAMRDRDYTSARKWIGEHSGEFDDVYRQLYDKARDLLTPESVPMLVVLIAKYMYQASFCADLEVNFAAFVAEVMTSVAWR